MRARLAQAIPAPQLVRAMLGGGERGQVRLGLDALAAVVRAGVARDLRHPVQDAHLMFRGDEGEGPPNQRVRDRVVVAVEAQVGSLAGAGRADEVARKRMRGQWQQARPFLVQRVADVAAGRIAGHGRVDARCRRSTG